MAEENTNINVNENQDPNNNNEGKEQEAATYTKEEVLALIQSESDKRVTQALKTQQRKFEQKLSLSQLDGDEREKAEKDQKIKELEEQLAEFQIEKNRSELKSVLSSRGLSAEFADILAVSDDIEAAQANIDKLDKLFKAAVKSEVEKRIGGDVPNGNGGGSKPPMTKEEFLKLPMAEMQRLLDGNPTYYNNLLK